jgi:uncharacterized protein (TIGR00299 family) protein
VARSLVFDCFSGIAGDMALGALLDAGASLERVRVGLAGLDLPAFSLTAEAVTRGGLRATYLLVTVPREVRYSPAGMRERVGRGGFPVRVRERSLSAIDALERGEAAAHATESPHLHEAGGVDALVDIAGTMLALEDLDVESAWCPLVTVGAATIARTEHGAIPAAPGPAAAAILQQAGFTLRFVEAAHELVTPTGAAILAAVARPGPATLLPEAHGAGAGAFDPPGRPNALRVFLGRAPVEPGDLVLRDIVQLEANLDDMSPALLAHARDRLLEAGALDAWTEPIGMKKGRSATKLCLLAPGAEEQRFARLVLAETTTLGVRVAPYRRYEAARAVETVETSFGPVRVKVRRLEGRRRLAPEFEDVRAIAHRLGLPALEVQERLEGELRGRG